ncbi:MAG: sigma-54 dependent transcriptional regulator [Planctomycetes bacterium]|nr:sigma-54 dependent transcriptional regulator [Planctomycetota bacterium]
MSLVLIVDDKEMMRDSVAATLSRAGFEVSTATDAGAALESMAKRRPDVVITDLRMPGQTGVELLEAVKKIDEDLPVILMTAFGTIETAVRAMKSGAFDYLTKPFEGDELIIAAKRAVSHAKLTRENGVLKAAADVPVRRLPTDNSGKGIDRLIGESAAMKGIKDQLKTIAQSHGNVLVTGPSGAGKEVVARAIHEMSPRASGPFLAVNCAALSESLLESELFGHERGAFTGADKLRKGRFELADGGTLLLDEISEVSPSIQAKLLRVLQERAFERVGSSVTMGIDVRVIATSNRDLPKMAAEGGFREDLFFRLNVLPITLPPLRERLSDVPALAASFVREICRREGRCGMRFSDDALRRLQAYEWAGNVRELQNICERAVVLGANLEKSENEIVIPASLIEPWIRVKAEPLTNRAELEAKPVPAAPSNQVVAAAASDLIRTLDEIEREAIVRTLMKMGRHRQRTAQALGIGVRTLGLKLKKWKEEQLIEQTL